MSNAEFHSRREERATGPGTVRRGLGRLIGLREAMSALPLIMSALPSAPDILVAVTDFRL